MTELKRPHCPGRLFGARHCLAAICFQQPGTSLSSAPGARLAASDGLLRPFPGVLSLSLSLYIYIYIPCYDFSLRFDQPGVLFLDRGCLGPEELWDFRFEIPLQTLGEDFFVTRSVVAEARIELRAFRIQERSSTN